MRLISAGGQVDNEREYYLYSIIPKVRLLWGRDLLSMKKYCHNTPSQPGPGRSPIFPEPHPHILT